MSCWRYTPTPKQDRFQDLLEAICPRIVLAMASSSAMVLTYSGAAQKSVRLTESEDGVFLALSLISIANNFSR